MSEDMILPERLEGKALDQLVADLRSKRGAPIRLLGASVAHCGALGVQLLFSARRQWASNGEDFSLDNPSAALISACDGLGVPRDAIGIAIEEPAQ